MNNPLELKITVKVLLDTYSRKNYTAFTNDGRNYNLNIFGVRAIQQDTNTFNDIVGAFWKYTGEWHLVKYAATTDPGEDYMLNPENEANSTHIMKEGQYRGAYVIGKHAGRYDCLHQDKPISFYCDSDKDKAFDRNEANVQSLLIGANIHSTISGSKYGVIPDLFAVSFPDRESEFVKNWSAACQVIANPCRFQDFMRLVFEAGKLYGNRFSYTLLNEADLLLNG